MALKFSEGIIGEPQLTVIYGVAGIGKSTLAALWPSPVFIDTEKGSRRLAVPRLTIENLKEFNEALDYVIGKDGKRFKTVVVDTVDWLEAKIREAVVKKYSEKDRSFDREGGFIANELMPILTKLSTLRENGKHVVLLAHSCMVTADLPDQKASFQRYELDMNKKHTAPLVKHWGDNLLFLRWKIQVRESDEVKNKGIGGTDRLLCTTQTAAYDAKNRYALKGEYPGGDLWTDAIKVIRDGFLSVGAEWEPGEVLDRPVTLALESQVAAEKEKATVPASAASVTQGEPVEPVVVSHESKPEPVETQGASKEVSASPSESAPVNDPIKAARAAIAGAAETAKSAKIVNTPPTKEEDTIPGLNPLDPVFVKLAEENEEIVNGLLIDRKEIKTGETWRNVNPDYVTRVLRNPAEFLAQCVKLAGGGK